ncbi:unnamed protein product, partial [Phaeothamnion confervicola]
PCGATLSCCPLNCNDDTHVSVQVLRRLQRRSSALRRVMALLRPSCPWIFAKACDMVEHDFLLRAGGSQEGCRRVLRSTFRCRIREHQLRSRSTAGPYLFCFWVWSCGRAARSPRR